MAIVRRIFALVILLSAAIGVFLLPRRPTAAQLSSTPEQKLWAVYWTAAPGFTSTLEIKNNRLKETLTVRPTLYLRSGEELPLEPLTLGPRETAVVNINQALAAFLHDSLGDRQRGSLEVDFLAPNDQALMGTVSVTNPTNGIAWNFRLYTVNSSNPAAPVRGLFWFPDEKTKGLVEIQNASEDFITVSPSFEIKGAKYSLPPTRVAPDQGFTLDLREELRKLGLVSIRAGGIELAYDGPGDALKAHEVLFNREGFSTEVDLLPSQSHKISHPLALRTPQFAVGPADPRMGLPPETSFEPTLVLHNFESSELSATLFVNFHNGGTPAEKQFPVSLPSGETQVLALYPLLKNLVPSDTHWASLEIQYSSNQNALAAALVSTSRDGEHSIRSVLNWVMGSASDGPFWQADAAHDTLIGMYNADTQPAKVSVSIDYYIGSERHQHKLPPLMIPARSARQVDVGDILAAGEPDANGDVIPPEVSFGGYRVQKVGPRINQVLITQSLLFDSGAKSYLTFYNTCCGYLNIAFSPNTLQGPAGDFDQLVIQAQDTCGGNTIDVTNSGNFGTLNSSIATVGAGNGQASLVAVGQTTLTSQLDYFEKDFFLGDCSSASAGSNTPTSVVRVTFSPPISYVVVGQTASTNATVAPTNNTTPISLNVTSAATVVSPTGTFTTNTGVVVKGLTVGTATLTATVPNPEGGAPIPVGATSFPVTSAAPTAVVTLRASTGQTVSSDNTAKDAYQSAEGTINIGPIIGTGPVPGCFGAFEAVGTITPSSYPGTVILRRQFLSDAGYTNSTRTGGSTTPRDDTTDPKGRDDNPQSTSPPGKVYDLDAPGTGTSAPPGSNIYRYRANFYEYAALPDGTIISSSYNFYVRVSCTKTSSGYQFVNDVSGDNQIGSGTTPLTWNLQ